MAPDTHWIGGWVGPRAVLDLVCVLILPGYGIISHIICYERRKKEPFGDLGIIFCYINN
jgi:hypothetical protein